MMEQSQVQKPQSVIMKNNQTVNTGSQSSHISIVAQDNFLLSQGQPPTPVISSSYSPVTLEQRKEYLEPPDQQHELVSIPMSTLQNILSQPGGGSVSQSEQSFGLTDNSIFGSNNQRKRTQQQMNWTSPGTSGVVFTVPSPLAMSPVYVDQKQVSSEDQVMSVMRSPVSRPSPQ